MEINIQDIFSRYPSSNKDNLIPILQDIQELKDFLSESDIILVGKYLNISSSKIYGVATFYNQFRFQPLGTYHIKICHGTACHLSSTPQLIKIIEKKLKIKPGQRTSKSEFSLEVVDCMGACSLSPIVKINDEYFSKVSSDMLIEIIDQFKKNIKE
ncbi:MAG: NAD(P)H-dependent oxidoreductase subunit E [Bacteroidota bacterium]